MKVKKKNAGAKAFTRTRESETVTQGQQNTSDVDMTTQNLMNSKFREQKPLVIQDHVDINDEPIQVQKGMHFNDRVRLKKNITNLENGRNRSQNSSNSFGES